MSALLCHSLSELPVSLCFLHSLGECQCAADATQVLGLQRDMCGAFALIIELAAFVLFVF